MRRGRLVVGAAASLMVVGCTPGTPPAGIESPTSVTSASPPTPTPTGPSVLDVSRFEEAAFSAPNGNLWCVLTADGVSCLIPRGYTGPAPKLAEPCPSWVSEGDLRPNTLILDAQGRPRWVCLDDQAARPFRDDPASAWQRGFGTWGRSDGQLIAVLPRGRKLRNGPYECRSDAAEVTCTNTNTKHGLSLSQEDVTLT